MKIGLYEKTQSHKKPKQLNGLHCPLACIWVLGISTCLFLSLPDNCFVILTEFYMKKALEIPALGWDGSSSTVLIWIYCAALLWKDKWGWSQLRDELALKPWGIALDGQTYNNNKGIKIKEADGNLSL